MTTSTESTTGARGRAPLLVILVVTVILAAVLGAYIDWVWWPVYSGLILTIAAGPILLVGAIVALIGHGIVRRIGLVVLAVGIGLLAGQNLGPTREPLIYQPSGTMTLRLESPVVASATSAADCTNVASGTEFQVSGDPNMRLDTSDHPFVSVYLDVGDRWEALGNVPRTNGVRLEITSTAALVSEDGKPGPVGMVATETSTLESSLSNGGGSIRFAGLEARTGPGFSGESIDLSGTLEWTCGEVMSETQPE